MEIFKIKSKSELKQFTNVESYRRIQKLDLFDKIIHGYVLYNTIYFKHIDQIYCISKCFANKLYPKIHKIKIL